MLTIKLARPPSHQKTTNAPSPNPRGPRKWSDPVRLGTLASPRNEAHPPHPNTNPQETAQITTCLLLPNHRFPPFAGMEGRECVWFCPEKKDSPRASQGRRGPRWRSPDSAEQSPPPERNPWNKRDLGSMLGPPVRLEGYT